MFRLGKVSAQWRWFRLLGMRIRHVVVSSAILVLITKVKPLLLAASYCAEYTQVAALCLVKKCSSWISNSICSRAPLLFGCCDWRSIAANPFENVTSKSKEKESTGFIHFQLFPSAVENRVLLDCNDGKGVNQSGNRESKVGSVLDECVCHPDYIY